MATYIKVSPTQDSRDGVFDVELYSARDTAEVRLRIPSSGGLPHVDDVVVSIDGLDVHRAKQLLQTTTDLRMLLGSFLADQAGITEGQSPEWDVVCEQEPKVLPFGAALNASSVDQFATECATEDQLREMLRTKLSKASVTLAEFTEVDIDDLDHSELVDLWYMMRGALA